MPRLRRQRGAAMSCEDDAEQLSLVRRLAYEFGWVGATPRSLNLEEFLRCRLKRAEDASRLEHDHAEVLAVAAEIFEVAEGYRLDASHQGS